MLRYWFKCIFLVTTLTTGGQVVAGQRVTNTVMMEYSVSVNAENKMSTQLAGSSLKIYLNHDECREETNTPVGREIRLFNAKIGKGAILKEFSGQKLMVPLSREDWSFLNELYSNALFSEIHTDEEVICGYSSQKAVAYLPGNKKLVVYYAPGFAPANSSYSYCFPQLNGLPLKIERHTPDGIYVWQLNDIQFGPLSSGVFDIDIKGYRLMPFEIITKE